MPRAPRSPLAKHWCFTLNNPDVTSVQLLAAFATWELDYAIFQEEVSASGTQHLQGYLEFTRRRRLSAIKKLPHAAQMHLETRKGTREEARSYCSKDDTRVAGPYEFGEWASSAQGKRTDLTSAIDTLRTSGMRAAANEFPSTFVRYHRGLAAYQTLLTPTRSDVPSVTLLYGPPGCGKTRFVHDNHDPDALWSSPPGSALQWFDGYAAHSVALIDDFDGKASKVPLRTVLQILDRYPITVPVKGAFVPWSPSHVYVTTNLHPREWYDWSARESQYGALSRRFTRVLHWHEASDAASGCDDLVPSTPAWDAFFAQHY